MRKFYFMAMKTSLPSRGSFNFPMQYFYWILFAISLLLFGQTIWFEFLNFDDEIFILKNPAIADPSLPWKACLEYKFKAPDYFPVSFLSWRALREIFGFNPMVFHGLNVLLHTLNVLLVFQLSAKIAAKVISESERSRWFAFFIALAFCIHPLHVESVAWVIDLKDVLSAAFYLGGMLLYIRWINEKKNWLLVLTFLMAALSMLSKSTGITFIAAIFWLDWVYNRKITWKLLPEKIPFLLLVVLGAYLFGLLTGNFQIGDEAAIKENPNAELYFPSSIAGYPDWAKSIIVASIRSFIWIKNTILPWSQTVFYSRKMLLDQYAGFLVIAPIIFAGLFFGLFLYRRKLPLALQSVVLFFILLSPALAQSQAGVAIFVPDRYMYLPLLALLWFIGALLVRLPMRWSIAIVSFLLLFWGIQTIRYIPAWKNSKALYYHAIKIEPACPEAILNLSKVVFAEGDTEESLRLLNQYIAYYKHDWMAYSNRGKLYMDKKEYEKAIEDFTRLLQLKPKSMEGLVGRGASYISLKDYEKARIDLSEAYDLDSTHFIANKNIASLYYNVGNHAICIQFADKCLFESPNDYDILNMKGISLLTLGRDAEAMAVFSKMLELKPEDGMIYYYRAMARFMMKDFPGVRLDLETARNLGVVPESKFEQMLENAEKLANK